MDDRFNASRKTIAFLTAKDGKNPRSWSGIPFYMARSLEHHLGEIRHLGPMPAWPQKMMKAGAKLRDALLSDRSLPSHETFLAVRWGRAAEERLAEMTPAPDVVFSPVGSVLLARFRTDLPVVYSSDTTLRLMLDYYPQFTGLSSRSVRVADDLERAAIARADLLLYPTHWAAESAINDYGADPAKIRVLPYGANLTEEPEPRDPDGPGEDGDRPCRLLMVGVDWNIKGGAVAVEALRRLQARGLPAELTIVGCTPPDPIEMPGLSFIPFLDKNSAADRARLAGLYQEADFFILPSRCECYGIVFCEAAAYGLPALATRTGGIPEVVREGETGYTLPLAEGGEAYAARIAELWSDRSRYRALRRSSREAFETRLNWDSWGRDAAGAIRNTIATRAAV